MNKILKYLSIIFVSIGIFTACSNADANKLSNDISSLKSNLEINEKKLLQETNQVNILKEKLQAAEEKINDLENQLHESTAVVSSSMEETDDFLKIVSMDIDYNKFIEGEISNLNLSIEDSIDIILTVISIKYFEGTKLELNTIETIEDKKVAVINLLGDTSYWSSRMQGTTGGTITTYTLVENLLQREYTDEWIDGVRFLIDGVAPPQMQHAEGLSEITYK